MLLKWVLWFFWQIALKINSLHKDIFANTFKKNQKRKLNNKWLHVCNSHLISISLTRNSWYDVCKSKKVYKLQLNFSLAPNCILWWFSRIISKSLWELWVELRKSLAAVYFAFENVQYGKGKSSLNSNFPHSQLRIIKRGQRPLPWLNSGLFLRSLGTLQIYWL